MLSRFSCKANGSASYYRVARSNKTVTLNILSFAKIQLLRISRHLKPGAMRFIVHHGSQRRKNADPLSSFDVVLTTYETVRAEHLQSLGGGRSAFHTISWHRVVLDEGKYLHTKLCHGRALSANCNQPTSSKTALPKDSKPSTPSKHNTAGA